MEITLKFDARQFRNISDSLRHLPQGTQRAMSASINKVLPGVRTDAVRAVSKVFTVKQSEARKTMTIRKASPRNLEGAVRSDGSPIPLIRFSVRPGKVTAKRPKGGVTVRVKRGNGSKLKGGFIARMPSGHVGVFERSLTKKMNSNPKRAAIEQKFGPAVPSMLKDTGAHKRIQEQADARLAKTIDHEIERILKGFGK